MSWYIIILDIVHSCKSLIVDYKLTFATTKKRKKVGYKRWERYGKSTEEAKEKKTNNWKEKNKILWNFLHNWMQILMVSIAFKNL